MKEPMDIDPQRSYFLAVPTIFFLGAIAAMQFIRR